LNRLSNQARQYASAATATAESTASTSSQHIPPVAAQSPAKAYRILASPVVSRPPLITRDLTSFEEAYFLYQKRLNERLALPFSRYFYYKKATPADVEWKRKARNRRTAARDIGVYSGYGDEAWNDEVLMGDQTASVEAQREALIRDAEGREILGAEAVGDKEANKEQVSGDAKVGEGQRKDLELHVERPAPRVTEADEKNDTLSLNRKLDQTLYLLVKDKAGRWRFPEDRLFSSESLHTVSNLDLHVMSPQKLIPSQAAERVIVQSAGLNMNTWVVGNHPVAYYDFQYPKPQIRDLTYHQPAEGQVETNTYKHEELGEKVFFMKARIMAGQADVSKSIYGHQAFQWLTKSEIQPVVTPKYWSCVRNMLAER
jgi:large subunit ribosomal protein L46